MFITYDGKCGLDSSVDKWVCVLYPMRAAQYNDVRLKQGASNVSFQGHLIRLGKNIFLEIEFLEPRK
jgi:hypothetical protein